MVCKKAVPAARLRLKDSFLHVTNLIKSTHQDQRQQTRLRSKILLPPPKTLWKSPRPKAANSPHKQDFAASAEDPMKLARTKSSNHAIEAGFCCLRRSPDETAEGQRQQSRLVSRILLPPPKTRWNSLRSKAADTPRKQDFAASAEDPMKLPEVKGSNHALRSRILLLLL